MNRQTNRHTPGPWHVVEGDEWTSGIATNTPEQGIWEVASANKRRDEFEANKRLISAAPDLLTICEKLVALKDLWLIPEDVPPEHQGEAETMHLLFSELKRAIRKAVEE